MSKNENIIALLKDLLVNDTELFIKILNAGNDDVNTTSLTSFLSDIVTKPREVLTAPEQHDPSVRIDGDAMTSSSIGSTSVRQDVCTSTSADRDVYYDLTQIPWVRYSFVVIYLLVTVLSFLGNLMVIWTVSRNRHMRTVTNYYIRNLAVCDLLVAACVMPLKLLEYTAPCSWHVFAKDALCSVVYYILPVFVFASVLTLVAISLERCHAIVNPFSAMTMHSKTRTRAILIATWLIPLVLAAPYLYCRSYAFTIQSPYGSISRQICTDRFSEIDVAIHGEEHLLSGRFRKGFFIFISLTMYLIPMLVIVVTCIRIAVCLLRPMDTDHQLESSYGMKITRKRGESKRRVARMIITIAIAFIVCWTPFYLVSFISQMQEVSFLHKSNFLFTMLATHLSGFLNSAINPFIYHFMSEKFRKSFISIIRSFFCCPLQMWQRKSEPSYSWAVKCEQDYCQHRFEKQRSSSSHSHSNRQDFGGHSRVQYKASPKLPSQVQGRHKSENYALRDNPRKDPYKRKEVTIVKNKQTTSLYCGPFCVCECQGCSIQSSSSQPSMNQPSTKIPMQGQVDTLTEYQLLIHQESAAAKRQQSSIDSRPTQIELQPFSSSKGDKTRDRTASLTNLKQTGTTKVEEDSKSLSGVSLHEPRTSYHSHSDSKIYKRNNCFER